MEKLVVATHNAGKLAEIRDLLGAHVGQIVSASALGLPEPDETGHSFADNAILKAVAAMKASGLPALADDSGLCVRALGGAPGVFSARWAGPHKDFASAMARIHREMGDTKDRFAEFVCVLALAQPGAQPECFEGRLAGAICWPPRGDQGFHYDPFFVPEGQARSFAEMEPHEKNAISHRARAFSTLLAQKFGADSKKAHGLERRCEKRTD